MNCLRWINGLEWLPRPREYITKDGAEQYTSRNSAVCGIRERKRMPAIFGQDPDAPSVRRAAGYLPAPRHAFVDSYGDANLATEKDGTTGSFIIAAVVVPGDRVDGLRAAVDLIRARHFGSAELRSNKMDDARRLRVIKDLCELDFAFVALAIDKARVSRDGGLIYKEPFLKYSHRVLFERLYRAHPDLRVVADEHGHPEFMEGFRRYVEAQASPDLFRRPTFGFAKSHSDPLIQVADVIAGTLARSLDPKKHTDIGE
jgi:hypothetical protein